MKPFFWNSLQFASHFMKKQKKIEKLENSVDGTLRKDD